MEKAFWKNCHVCDKQWPSKGPNDLRPCGSCRDDERTAGFRDALEEIKKLPKGKAGKARKIAERALTDFGRLGVKPENVLPRQ